MVSVEVLSGISERAQRANMISRAQSQMEIKAERLASHSVAMPGDGMRIPQTQTLARVFDLPDRLHDEISALAEG